MQGIGSSKGNPLKHPYAKKNTRSNYMKNIFSPKIKTLIQISKKICSKYLAKMCQSTRIV